MSYKRFAEEYKGVVVRYGPQRLANGRWAPHLVVTDRRGETTTETTFVVDVSGEFGSEEQAAEQARAAGRDWVDKHS